ncbi:MAG: VWA domain-containing protein [Chitinophagales bacterium]|nr:VWA domain-containing protein [Chitinophagales bacterium]
MNKIFTLFFCLILTSLSFATSNIIKGYIKDTDTKKAIANVTIELDFSGQQYFALTDSNGFYQIETTVQYIDDNYPIRVSHKDYYELIGFIKVAAVTNRSFSLKSKTVIEEKILDTMPIAIVKEEALEGFADNNWVMLLDVSSSMNETNKMPFLKSGLKDIVNLFRKEDKVAILTFSTATKEILPSTTGTEKTKILNAIDNIKVGGQSQGASAFDNAFQTAKQNYINGGSNRIIICTDGMFTSGKKEYANILKVINKYLQDDIHCSIFLFGEPTPYVQSNIEQLAIAGGGNFAIINSTETAKTAFLKEAKAVKK